MYVRVIVAGLRVKLFCFVLVGNTHPQRRALGLVSDAKCYLPACDDGCNIFVRPIAVRLRVTSLVRRSARDRPPAPFFTLYVLFVVGSDVVAWPNASGHVLAIHLPVATGIILWDRW